ncbi:MAG: HAD-IB family phosphatase [Planctomycetota bacterium]
MTTPASHHPPFERIVFDCDSTLSCIEGIEELAAGCAPEVRREIEETTRLAMDGRVPLEQVFARRLSLVSPSRAAVEAIGARYIACAVPQVRETLAALAALGKELHVVSGGLLPAVRPFAEWLGVPASHVHAVPLDFDETGRYAGFDAAHPLACSGGKRHVVAGLCVEPQHAARTAFIGDGMTDAETRDVVDCFLCFTGVVGRPGVTALAHAVVAGPSFAALLPHLCDEGELAVLARDPAHRGLLRDARI